MKCHICGDEYPPEEMVNDIYPNCASILIDAEQIPLDFEC